MHLSRFMGAALLVLTLPGFVAAQDPRNRPAVQRFRPGADAPGRPFDNPASQLNTTSARSPEMVGGKTLAQWENDLTSGDPGKRIQAVQMIPLFGEAAGRSVSRLVGRVSDPDVAVRTKAIIALRALARWVDRKDVPRLVQAMVGRMNYGNETQSIVIYEALRTLALYPDDAKNYLSTVIRATKNLASAEIRQTAVAILRRAGWDKKTGPDSKATEALLYTLEHDPSFDVRLEAIIGLGTMGSPADPKLLGQVVGDLKALLTRSSDKNLVIWSHVSLLFLDNKVTDSSLDALAQFLEKTDKRGRTQELKVRMTAAQALGALGAKASPKIPNLLRMLRPGEEAPGVVAASSALGMIGYDRKKGNESIIDALLQVAGWTDDKQLSAVVAACTALGQVAPGEANVAEALRKLRERPDIQGKEKESLRNVLKTAEDYIRNPPREEK